jgi:hypothetical protein
MVYSSPNRVDVAYVAGGLAVSLLALASACAEGGDDGGTGGTTVQWTSTSDGGGASSSGTGGGGGSSTSSSGSGGTGGTTSSGSGGTLTGGSGGTGTGGGGGSPGGRVLILAAGSSSVLGGSFAPNQGWTTQTLSGATGDRPALALTSGGDGVGALRQTGTGALRFTVWTAGNWAALADVASQLTTRAAPALAGDGSAAQLVSQGDDYMHYYGAYQGSWNPTDEQVKPPSLPQSYGPSSAAIAQLGADVVVAFAGNDGSLYAQTRSSGSWQGAANVTGSKLGLSPAIVALSSGAELMVVYVNDDSNQPDDKKIFWSIRTSGAWAAPLKISDAVFTDEVPALAPLAGGAALLAFRGTDGKPYTLRYTAGANPPWGAPFGVDNPNPSVASPPVVARGVGGVDAELAYVSQGTGSAAHCRLTGLTWSAPVVVGGTGLDHVAIASAP